MCGFIGFTGDYGTRVMPNPTGDLKQLYWPIKGSGLGLRITGMSYYLEGYGNLSDPIDYFKSGNYQMIGDIIYTGFAFTGTNAPTTDLYQYTGNPFNQNILTSGVLIHVPAPYYTSGTPQNTALIAVVEQIKITGITYSIVSI